MTGRLRFSRAAMVTMVLVAGCFRGAERDKPPQPGDLGGLCAQPDGRCEEGQCNRTRNYCFDAAVPCSGFFCGGEERGTCVVDDASQPSCTCKPGFDNEFYLLYCCPTDGTAQDDEYCAPPMTDDGGDEGSSG